MKKYIICISYAIVTGLIMWRLFWWGKNYAQQRLHNDHAVVTKQTNT